MGSFLRARYLDASRGRGPGLRGFACAGGNAAGSVAGAPILGTLTVPDLTQTAPATNLPPPTGYAPSPAFNLNTVLAGAFFDGATCLQGLPARTASGAVTFSFWVPLADLILNWGGALNGIPGCIMASAFNDSSFPSSSINRKGVSFFNDHGGSDFTYYPSNGSGLHGGFGSIAGVVESGDVAGPWCHVMYSVDLSLGPPQVSCWVNTTQVFQGTISTIPGTTTFPFATTGAKTAAWTLFGYDWVNDQSLIYYPTKYPNLAERFVLQAPPATTRAGIADYIPPLPTQPPDWDSTVTYQEGAVVVAAGQVSNGSGQYTTAGKFVYQSATNGNKGFLPGIPGYNVYTPSQWSPNTTYPPQWVLAGATPVLGDNYTKAAVPPLAKPPEIEQAVSTTASGYPGNLGYNGCVAEFWVVTGLAIDWSVQANRELFHSPEAFAGISPLMPVNLAPDGSAPLIGPPNAPPPFNQPPWLYLSASPGTVGGLLLNSSQIFALNRANGKFLTVRGQIQPCADSAAT